MKEIEVTNSANTAVELNDEVLEEANGGIIINNDHRTTNTWAPVQDAVNINNDHRTVNTWAPSDIAVNINNDH